MIEHSIELTAGEVVRIGEMRLVVLEILDDEVTFRIEGVEGSDAPSEITAARVPR